jgi:hypothetical protein
LRVSEPLNLLAMLRVNEVLNLINVISGSRRSEPDLRAGSSIFVFTASARSAAVL